MALAFDTTPGVYNYTTSSVRFAALDEGRPVVYAIARAALAKAEGVPILVPDECVRAAARHGTKIREVVHRKFALGLRDPDGVVMVEVGDVDSPPAGHWQSNPTGSVYRLSPPKKPASRV